MKKTIIALGLSSILGISVAHAMTELVDNDLAHVTGQALLNMSVQAGQNVSVNELDPTDPSKQVTRSFDQSKMKFYKLSLVAEISLNANIKKLQLGCGGDKGGGLCDIDIDNISLVGINPVVGADGVSSYANSDFVIDNPFVEFAIENAGSTSTRQISGFRLGALSALGMMSIGENTDITKLDDDKGINRLSGDIGVRVTNALMNNVQACLSGTNPSGTGCFIGNNALLKGTALVADYNTTLISNRSDKFSLLGMNAKSDEHLLNLDLPNVNMNGIPYATVHKLVIADASGNPTSNAFLSLQKKDIVWQNVSDGSWKTVAAQKGWWMSIPNTQFDNLKTDQALYLSAVGAIAGSVLDTPVNIQGVDLGQMPISNCFGGHKFC